MVRMCLEVEWGRVIPVIAGNPPWRRAFRLPIRLTVRFRVTPHRNTLMSLPQKSAEPKPRAMPSAGKGYPRDGGGVEIHLLTLASDSINQVLMI